MTVESATYISQLNSSNPSGSDAKSEGDDHLRLLKATIKATFPNFGAAALQASNTQIDKLVTTFSITSAPSASVFIDSGGNVGIGTSTLPAGRRVTISGGAVRLDADANLEFGGSSAGLYGNSVNNSVTLFTNTTSRVVIDSSGNVIKTVVSVAPTLTVNGSMVFTIPSDTQLRVSVRGSDGVTRTANLTLS